MKEELRLMKKLQKRFHFSQQRMHVLMSEVSSRQLQGVWEEICYRLDINCKIASEIPPFISEWSRND